MPEIEFDPDDLEITKTIISGGEVLELVFGYKPEPGPDNPEDDIPF